jgi:hypothetical protein
MSEIISSSNPFGEPDPNQELEFIIGFDPYRNAAASILRYMEAVPPEEVLETYDQRTNTTSRQVTFACTGPYNEKDGIYTNPLATPQQQQNRVTMPTIMSAGTDIVNAEPPSYWATIQRRDGKPFGVAGVSREEGRRHGKIERWHALTTIIKYAEGEPVVTLWAEDKPNGRPRQLLTGFKPINAENAKKQHCQTVQTVMDRTIRKRQQ